MKKFSCFIAVVCSLFFSYLVKGQESATKQEAADNITALKGDDSMESIQVSPNPSINIFNVIAGEDFMVKVFDHQGVVVEQFKTNGAKKTFGEELLPGVYHLNFIQNNKVVKQMNVVKNW